VRVFGREPVVDDQRRHTRGRNLGTDYHVEQVAEWLEAEDHAATVQIQESAARLFGGGQVIPAEREGCAVGVSSSCRSTRRCLPESSGQGPDRTSGELVARGDRRNVSASRYGDLFTEDATYVEHLYGKMAARAKICEWIASTMKVFRGSEKPFYPVTWYSIDVDKGWVFSEIMNPMKDPGDGSIHEAPCITILRYGGDGLWSNEEDAYNPMNFMPMVEEYIRRCHKLGAISEDARKFAANMNWALT
jgi:hypothetical protein